MSVLVLPFFRLYAPSILRFLNAPLVFLRASWWSDAQRQRSSSALIRPSCSTDMLNANYIWFPGMTAAKSSLRGSSIIAIGLRPATHVAVSRTQIDVFHLSARKRALPSIILFLDGDHQRSLAPSLTYKVLEHCLSCLERWMRQRSLSLWLFHAKLSLDLFRLTPPHPIVDCLSHLHRSILNVVRVRLTDASSEPEGLASDLKYFILPGLGGSDSGECIAHSASAGTEHAKSVKVVSPTTTKSKDVGNLPRDECLESGTG